MNEKTKYQVIRTYNGSKGYGPKFDTLEEAQRYIATKDWESCFSFHVEEVKE